MSPPDRRGDELDVTACELLHDLAGEMESLRAFAGNLVDTCRAVGHAEEAEWLHRELDRVGLFVSDMVARSAGRSPSSVCHVRTVVSNAAERLRRLDRRPEIVTRFAIPDVMTVAAPPSFVDRVVGNLLRNARRHAREHVLVSLHGRVREGRAGVEIRVEDDGPGVAVSQSEAIFRPGVSRAGSTGFGLSSVRWLVSQMGGFGPTIGRADAGGAAFEVWLPVAAAVAVRPTPTPTMAEVRILLLEDDPAVRRAIQRLLERRGAIVHSPHPTEEQVEQLIGGFVAADIILMDRELGLTRNGEEIWHELHARNPALAERTVLMTGHLGSDGGAGGGPVVLGKPLSLEALERALMTPSGRSVRS